MPKKPFNGRIELDVRDSVADWSAFTADAAPEGAPERAGRALRRHRPGRVVALRRPDRDADAAAAGRRRPDVLAVAHDGAVLADALDVPDRSQPPLQRLRVDLGVLDRLPGLQLAHPARERDDRPRPARRGLQHVLGRQEPQRAGRRVDDGRVQEGVAARRRASTASTASSAARPTTGIPTSPRTTTTSTSPTARGGLPPVEGPGRPGAADDPRLQAVRARQALVPVVLPGRQPRPAPRARRSTSTSTRASSTTATRPTASGCCRG